MAYSVNSTGIGLCVSLYCIHHILRTPRPLARSHYHPLPTTTPPPWRFNFTSYHWSNKDIIIITILLTIFILHSYQEVIKIYHTVAILLNTMRWDPAGRTISLWYGAMSLHGCCDSSLVGTLMWTVRLSRLIPTSYTLHYFYIVDLKWRQQ